MPGRGARGDRGSSARDLERELARARGSRRLLPWAFLSALAAGVLAWVAGGGPKGGAALAAVGLVFVLFVWTTSIARCPACGARLPPDRYRGSREGARPESCPSCGARFD